MNSTDGDESRGIRRPGNCAGSNQSLKPDILRDAIRGRNAERAHELSPIFLIRKEPARRFRSLLLKTLECEHASVMGRIWKKRNGSVIFSHRSCPSQAFILWLLTRKRAFVHKYFGALTDDGLTFAEIKFVLQKRHPGIRARASYKNVIVVVQVAHPQVPRIAHGHLRLQCPRHFEKGDDVRYIREGSERRVRNILTQSKIGFTSLADRRAPQKIPAEILVEGTWLTSEDTGHSIVAVGYHNNRLVSRIENLRRRPRKRRRAWHRAGSPARDDAVRQHYAQHGQNAAYGPRNHRSAAPCHDWNYRRCNRRREFGRFQNRSEYRSVGAFGYVQYDWFITTFFIEILVKFQAQLPSVYPYGAVLQRAVIGRFVEQRVADVLLG